MNLRNILWALASRHWLKTKCSAAKGWVVEVGVCIRSLTANLRETKSLYHSPPESTKELRTGARQTARFNQPATRLASNPDLQICKHCFRTLWFTQSSVEFRAYCSLVHREITPARYQKKKRYRSKCYLNNAGKQTLIVKMSFLPTNNTIPVLHLIHKHFYMNFMNFK